jgi:hypothetical protein
MAVEEASEVRVGDRIRLGDRRSGPGLEVTAARHGTSESVIYVRVAGLYCQRLEFLPDDAVMVTYYSNES